MAAKELQQNDRLPGLWLFASSLQARTNVPSASAGTNVKHATASTDFFGQRINRSSDIWEAWCDGRRDTAILLMQDAAELFRGYLVNGRGSRVSVLCLKSAQLNGGGWHSDRCFADNPLLWIGHRKELRARNIGCVVILHHLGTLF